MPIKLATEQDLTDHEAATSVHGATALNTASRIVSRNADGSFTISGIQLDTSATPTSAVGFLRWNDTDKCAEIQTLDGVVVQIGQESNIYARNESGSTLANGKAVVVDGSVGQRMTFILADSTSAAARKTIGLVTSDSGISNNGFGFVTTFGLVRDLNTSAFTDGDELFLSTAGNYITTKPVAESSSVVRIGWVIRAHATEGSIFVAPHFHGTVVGDAVMNAVSKAAARTAIGADEQVKSANFTAVAGESYVITASATVTDPSSPVNGQSYRVRVSAGTATVGGVEYSTVGTTVARSYNGGAWISRELPPAEVLKSYAAGGFGLRRTHSKLGAMGNGGVSQQRFLMWADSMNGFGGDQMGTYFGEVLESGYGQYGQGTAPTSATAGYAGISSVSYDYWPTGYTAYTETGGSYTYSRGGSLAYCDTLKIYYIIRSGAGTFKVQSSTDGSTWADEAGYTSVDANGSTALGIITISKTLGLYMTRVVGLSGRVEYLVTGCGQFRTTSVSSLDFATIATAGLELANANTSSAAILSAWLADYSPDLGFFEMKESPGGFSSTNLSTFQSRMNAGAPLMDWVFILSVPSSTGNQDIIDQVDQLRTHADTNGYATADLYSLFRDYAGANSLGLMADGVHRSTLGNKTAAAYVINHFALDSGYGGIRGGSVSAPYLAAKSRLSLIANGTKEAPLLDLDILPGSSNQDSRIKLLRALAITNTAGTAYMRIDVTAGTGGGTFFPTTFGVGSTGPWLRGDGTNLWVEATQGGPPAPIIGSDLHAFGNVLVRGSGAYVNYYDAGQIKDTAGTGSPEGVVTAPIGSTYRRLDGGAGTSFYFKESGSGNTGWVAKGAGNSSTATALQTARTINGVSFDGTANITVTPPDASAFKHKRVTTGSISAGSTALVTVTWTTPFADANYTVSASVVDSTTTSLSLSVVHVESVTANDVTVRVLNNALGSLTGTLHAIGIHD